MLELKQATKTTIPNKHNTPINWSCDADRIITVQKMMQTSSPFLISTVCIDDDPYLLKEMQPSQDKLKFDPSQDHSTICKLIDEMVFALVCAQMRSCDIA